MNIFLKELKMLRSAFLVWTAALLAASLMYQSVYPSFSKDAAAVTELFKHSPQVALKALNFDINSLLTFLGFYVVTLTLISLIMAFQATGIGITLLAREEQSKTTDFLLSKPVSRGKIFLSKLAAGLLVILASMTVYTIGTFLIARAFGAEDIDVEKYLMINLVLLLIQLWFFGFGIFLTQLKRIKSVIGTTLGVVFSFFAIGIVGSLVGEDKFRFLSPFKAVDYMEIVSGQAIEYKYTALLAIILIGGLIYAGWRYIKRDVRTLT